MLTAVLLISCSQAEKKNTAANSNSAPTPTETGVVSTLLSSNAPELVSNSSVPPVSRVKSVPPEGGDKPTKAEVNGYPYSYKKDGEKTVATFGPKLLPYNKAVVSAAIRDVIFRSYGDKIDSDPHIQGTGATQTIRVNSSEHQYLIVPTSEPNGEIHSLIITQLN